MWAFISGLRKVGLYLPGARPYAARKYGDEEVGLIVLVMLFQIINMFIDWQEVSPLIKSFAIMM